MGNIRMGGQGSPPTASASVLLCRDGASGVEVLLLERHLDSDFVGGALVFPGGKVDPADGQLPAAHRAGPDPQRDADQLGVVTADEAVALRVAAVRETFEEAGVLLAHDRDGRPVDAARLAADDAVAARQALVDRGPVADWHAWLVDAGLVLDLQALAPWSWWVTPEGVHRRFDTKFFVAQLPAAQAEVAAHDAVEVTSSRWWSPPAAVAAHHAGDAVVIFPTRCNLEDLARHRSSRTAVAASRDRTLTRIMPTAMEVDGEVLVQHPDGRPPERP